jgi:DnaJ-class molecular chaperone
VDYYAILGVPRNASGPDIKRAYHKLALQYHPDRNSSADAQAKFQEINRAYTIIGDPKGKKDEYDHNRMGH